MTGTQRTSFFSLGAAVRSGLADTKDFRGTFRIPSGDGDPALRRPGPSFLVIVVSAEVCPSWPSGCVLVGASLVISLPWPAHESTTAGARRLSANTSRLPESSCLSCTVLSKPAGVLMMILCCGSTCASKRRTFLKLVTLGKRANVQSSLDTQ